MTYDASKVPCRGGCGRTADLSYQIRIGLRLGFSKRPTYQCAECYKAEKAKLGEGDK